MQYDPSLCNIFWYPIQGHSIWFDICVEFKGVAHWSSWTRFVQGTGILSWCHPVLLEPAGHAASASCSSDTTRFRHCHIALNFDSCNMVLAWVIFLVSHSRPFHMVLYLLAIQGCTTVIFLDKVCSGNRYPLMMASSSSRASWACSFSTSSCSSDTTRFRHW